MSRTCSLVLFHLARPIEPDHGHAEKAANMEMDDDTFFCICEIIINNMKPE